MSSCSKIVKLPNKTKLAEPKKDMKARCAALMDKLVKMEEYDAGCNLAKARAARDPRQPIPDWVRKEIEEIREARTRANEAVMTKFADLEKEATRAVDQFEDKYNESHEYRYLWDPTTKHTEAGYMAYSLADKYFVEPTGAARETRFARLEVVPTEVNVKYLFATPTTGPMKQEVMYIAEIKDLSVEQREAFGLVEIGGEWKFAIPDEKESED